MLRSVRYTASKVEDFVNSDLKDRAVEVFWTVRGLDPSEALSRMLND